MNRAIRTLAAGLLAVWAASGSARGQAAPAPEALPFNHKVEVYRDKEHDITVFAIRLEQPFLAETFETSNYLRLAATDRNAYLIYPKETKFQQKHAEFYGRLRGQGKTKVRLAYETVRENLDGTRKINVRAGEIEIPIPTEDTGPKSIFTEWAKQQNGHFLELLTYYPEETFYQYCLLQSKDRYGVAPPPLPRLVPQRAELETSLYQVYSGGLAIQESLQRSSLGGTAAAIGDQTIHISELQPPRLQSLPYKDLLEKKLTKENQKPKPHEIARLVPADQYLLQFNSVRSATELGDLASEWGDNLLRLFTIQAQDNRLQEKLEDQLCLRRGPLTKLFADGVIAEMAVTGADPFVIEGSDVTVIFRLKQREIFAQFAQNWLADVKKKYAPVIEQEWNYRGHKVSVRYTNDRLVSSFVADHGDYVIYSNSHRAVRRVIDAVAGQTPALFDALDYRYVTTMLPPSDAENTGYVFASEEFLRLNVGPAAKISEKRRLECFNNLVMLNNASMFYRLEYGKSPATLNDLIEARFVDPRKVVCPHGGAYAVDVERDTCTCSLHNRLKYLTPNAEVPVLKVSPQERQEYERYKQRYQEFWQTMFDPLAARITVAPRVKIELCVLPFANGGQYAQLRDMLDKQPQPIDMSRAASSAVASTAAVLGRKRIGEFFRELPGIASALDADPTLTDLSWLGDRVSLHLCDEDTVLEVDPTRLQSLDVPLAGRASTGQQIMLAAAIWGMKMPVYVSVDVEDKDKAARLLDHLASKVFLQSGNLLSIPTRLDGYRLPDYKQHAVYVVSYQLHAVKLRLHMAIVGQQLVAATKPETLRQVIDAAANPAAAQPVEAHLLLRLNRRALRRLNESVELYWAEKSRLACHRNTISIYNLLKLYDAPLDQVGRLAESKYGVSYFCPEHGVYHYDAGTDQVACTVHGNRQHARQNPRLDQKSSFSRFVESLDEVNASLRFQDDALFTTVEIVRSAAAPPAPKP